MIKIFNVIMAIGNKEIEESISTIQNISRAESVETIDLIEEILSYDSYDYVIVNTLLSERKAVKLADFVDNSLDIKPKIIAIVETLSNKKLIAQLVGFGVNAFITFNELGLIGNFMDNYPVSFDLGLLAEEHVTTDIVASRVINGTISIGVFNLDSGAGATTCSLKLAEEIANCGYKVICLEIDQENFQYIKNKNKNLQLISTTTEEKDSLLQAAFVDKFCSFIVIDFGKVVDIDLIIQNGSKLYIKKKEYKDDFFRCTYKIGMGFASKWHSPRLGAFLENNPLSIDIMNNQLYFLLSGEKVRETIDDYHELLIWDREKIDEFVKEFEFAIGISNVNKKKKSYFLRRFRK